MIDFTVNDDDGCLWMIITPAHDDIIILLMIHIYHPRVSFQSVPCDAVFMAQFIHSSKSIAEERNDRLATGVRATGYCKMMDNIRALIVDMSFYLFYKIKIMNA